MAYEHTQHSKPTSSLLSDLIISSGVFAYTGTRRGGAVEPWAHCTDARTIIMRMRQSYTSLHASKLYFSACVKAILLCMRQSYTSLHASKLHFSACVKATLLCMRQSYTSLHASKLHFSACVKATLLCMRQSYTSLH